jgi:hypothetical protein
MKLAASLALAMTALGALCGSANAGGIEGYVADVLLQRNGEVVGRASLPMGPDGTSMSYVENTHDYRQSVSVGAEGATDKVKGRLTTGLTVRLGYRQEGDDLILDTQADFSELVGLDEFTSGGQTIDLPNVSQWSLQDAKAATPTDGGWRSHPSFRNPNA